MSSPFDGITDEQLQTTRENCQTVLQSLVESLRDRTDLQAVIQQMMQSEDMVETLFAVKDVDLKRMTIQASVAALVNRESVSTIDAEIARRAARN